MLEVGDVVTLNGYNEMPMVVVGVGSENVGVLCMWLDTAYELQQAMIPERALKVKEKVRKVGVVD